MEERRIRATLEHPELRCGNEANSDLVAVVDTRQRHRADVVGDVAHREGVAGTDPAPPRNGVKPGILLRLLRNPQDRDLVAGPSLRQAQGPPAAPA